jgi:ferredoxin
MKILILYYSGTGNTAFACQVARLVVQKAGHEVTMSTYKDAPADLTCYDAYCFGTPVYEWAPARNVEEFVRWMPEFGGRCCFIITSCAGARGQATELFATMLQDRGLTVLGDHNLLCPDSWGGTRRWSYSEDLKKPTPESVGELASFTGLMLERAGSFLAGETVEAPRYRVSRTGLYFASRLTRLAPSARFKMGRKKVQEASCTKCGVCAKNCPVGAIALDPFPRFGSDCIACWRCVNTCPQDCITCIIDPGKHYKGIPRRDELLESPGLE